MGRRVLVVFWSAAAAAVFLAGGVTATVPRVMARAGAADVAVLAALLLGLLASLIVAGRIAVVTGRVQRVQRATGHRSGVIRQPPHPRRTVQPIGVSGTDRTDPSMT